MLIWFFYSILALGSAAFAAESKIIDHKDFWDKKNWSHPQELVEVLQSVPLGEELWRQSSRTSRKGKLLLKELKLGSASYTESVFQRSYSLLTGEEIVTQKNKIYLNSKLTLAEAALDLAHELIHFNEKTLLNPYRENFSVEDFIKEGIEGKGGELAALQKECAISWQLEQKFENFPTHKICARYREANGAFAIERARSDYYSIESWEFPEELRSKLPLLNSRKINLSSSYAKKPYPLALYQDYLDTRKSACANNQKKYELISAQVESGRSPSSLMALEQERMRLKNYRERNCEVQAFHGQ